MTLVYYVDFLFSYYRVRKFYNLPRFFLRLVFRSTSFLVLSTAVCDTVLFLHGLLIRKIIIPLLTDLTRRVKVK